MDIGEGLQPEMGWAGRDGERINVGCPVLRKI
jgi:hypothetical protein